jgi:hypothetical protein
MSDTQWHPSWRGYLGAWVAGCALASIVASPACRGVEFVVSPDVGVPEYDYPGRCVAAHARTVAEWLEASTEGRSTQYWERWACFPGQHCPAREWPHDGVEWFELAVQGVFLGLALMVAYHMGLVCHTGHNHDAAPGKR